VELVGSLLGDRCRLGGRRLPGRLDLGSLVQGRTAVRGSDMQPPPGRGSHGDLEVIAHPVRGGGLGSGRRL
jgi:hypothetical protein